MLGFFRKKRFKNLVGSAYADSSSSEAQQIKVQAKRYIGREPADNLPEAKRFIHGIYRAIRQLTADTQVDTSLGVCPIDFAGVKINCLKSDANTASIALFGFSDNLTIFQLYEKYIPTGSCAIDIGGNIGMHAIVMSKLVGKQGKVYSYEPSPAIFHRLEQNALLNHSDNLVLRHTALGSEEGAIGFVDCADQVNIGISHVDEMSENQVPITTIDIDLADVMNISLIKLDVEGHELEVLKGGGAVACTREARDCD